jgi:hypothetical protein
VLRRILTASNLAISFVIWIPTILRVIARHSSGDISVLTLLLVLWLQIASALIAYLDRSKSLLLYFGINALNVCIALGTVLFYR